MNETLLIVGQVPPPYHGSNVMAKTMVAVLQKLKYKTIFINKKFAKTINSIGKPSLRKILRIPLLAFKLVTVCITEKPTLCIFFIACGKSAFLVDVLLVFVLRILKVPYVLRFGGKGYCDLAKEGFVWRFIVSKTLSNALVGIVLGEKLKEDVDSFIPHERLMLVPNGVVDIAIEERKYKKIPSQILFLSNLHPHKGTLEVLKAARKVIKKNKNIRFVLAGANGSEKFYQKLSAYIEMHGLQENIDLPGVIVGERKNKMFIDSDIFLFPSYFETFGIVNIEAMSWGLPIITTATGAIPEIVKNEENGFLVMPKDVNGIVDKIMLLVEKPGLCEAMGRRGREIYESKYTVDAFTINMKNTIDICINRIRGKG